MIYTKDNVTQHKDDQYLVLNCPCERRTVLITRENGHSWRFKSGKLTIDGSILNQDSTDRKCHLFITDGKPEFCGDSTCRGG